MVHQMQTDLDSLMDHRVKLDMHFGLYDSHTSIIEQLGLRLIRDLAAVFLRSLNFDPNPNRT